MSDTNNKSQTQSTFNIFRVTPQRILSDKEMREQQWKLNHTNSNNSHKNNKKK